jgi:hypothetical protein
MYFKIASNSENTWFLAGFSDILVEVTPSGIVARDLGSSTDWIGPIVDATGAVWLFEDARCGINALRVKDGVYQSATWSTGDTESSSHYKVVSSYYDHLFFKQTSGEYHMATLEGSCWSDLQVPGGTVLDVSGRLWLISTKCTPDDHTVSRTCTIKIHSLEEALPDEEFSFAKASDARVSAKGYASGSVIIPGGWGNAIASYLYELPSSGISMISYNPAASSHWEQHDILDSRAVTAGGNCPPLMNSNQGTCNGQSSCLEQVQGRGSYAAVRTADGAIFAAWLEYSLSTAYSLRDMPAGTGEKKYQPLAPYCTGLATSGTGTVDLVIVRLTDSSNSDAGSSDSTQSRTRFRLYEGEALGGNGEDSIAMAARGDTLAIAARQDVLFEHFNAWYLEIDSTQLP